MDLKIATDQTNLVALSELRKAHAEALAAERNAHAAALQFHELRAAQDRAAQKFLAEKEKVEAATGLIYNQATLSLEEPHADPAEIPGKGNGL